MSKKSPTETGSRLIYPGMPLLKASNRVDYPVGECQIALGLEVGRCNKLPAAIIMNNLAQARAKEQRIPSAKKPTLRLIHPWKTPAAMGGKTSRLVSKLFPVLTQGRPLFKLPEEGEGHAVRRGEGQNQKDQLPTSSSQSAYGSEGLASHEARL